MASKPTHEQAQLHLQLVGDHVKTYFFEPANIPCCPAARGPG